MAKFDQWPIKPRPYQVSQAKRRLVGGLIFRCKRQRVSVISFHLHCQGNKHGKKIYAH